MGIGDGRPLQGPRVVPSLHGVLRLGLAAGAASAAAAAVAAVVVAAFKVVAVLPPTLLLPRLSLLLSVLLPLLLPLALGLRGSGVGHDDGGGGSQGAHLLPGAEARGEAEIRVLLGSRLWSNESGLCL